MSKTNEGGMWDQNPVESGPFGSGFTKRTPNLKQIAVKTKVVRDDWDDDDDDDDAEAKAQELQETHQTNKATACGNRTDGAAPVLGLTSMGRRTQATSEQYDDGEESSKVWEEANKRAPMPELIVAPASTSQSFPPPPPAAFQPMLRILKRPSPNASSTNNIGASSSMSTSGVTSSSGPGGTSPAPPRGTLAEREAQYQEARSRIFGDKDEVGVTSPGSMSRTSSSSGGVVVVRDPLGPTSESELDPGTGGQDKARGSDRPAKGFGERRRGKK